MFKRNILLILLPNKELQQELNFNRNSSYSLPKWLLSLFEILSKRDLIKFICYLTLCLLAMPFDWNTENLKKYLTVEQALADLNSFTNYIKSTIQTTSTSKWFIFGGSYPGALSSWYRISYPKQSVGSLSSSGVVWPQVDYTGFDEAVSAAIGNECSNQIKKIN